MAMKDWFKRKSAPKTIGESKGGSRLIKYGDDETPKPEMGMLEESTLEYIEERELIYDQFFGESDTVLHELIPLIPHIDVYRFPPNSERNFYTFVTGGMSDLPMNSPSDVGVDYRRAEIIFYSTENRDEYPELLRFLAHFVHDNNTWLHWGHTMPNGQPPEPLFGTEDLDTLLFMPTIVDPDSSLSDKLQIESDPVNLLWCVPITTAECQLKLDEGSDALYDLFDANEHPFAFDGDRQSYV